MKINQKVLRISLFCLRVPTGKPTEYIIPINIFLNRQSSQWPEIARLKFTGTQTPPDHPDLWYKTWITSFENGKATLGDLISNGAC
jgi:hypothetical protein